MIRHLHMYNMCTIKAKYIKKPVRILDLAYDDYDDVTQYTATFDFSCNKNVIHTVRKWNSNCSFVFFFISSLK